MQLRETPHAEFVLLISATSDQRAAAGDPAILQRALGVLVGRNPRCTDRAPEDGGEHDQQSARGYRASCIASILCDRINVADDVRDALCPRSSFFPFLHPGRPPPPAPCIRHRSKMQSCGRQHRPGSRSRCGSTVAIRPNNSQIPVNTRSRFVWPQRLRQLQRLSLGMGPCPWVRSRYAAAARSCFINAGGQLCAAHPQARVAAALSLRPTARAFTREVITSTGAC